MVAAEAFLVFVACADREAYFGDPRFVAKRGYDALAKLFAKELT